MKKMIKKMLFVIIIVALILATRVVIKTGKFAKLEGYMYSFAAEITNSATDSNATSSNAQDCATSSNATSSNAQDCATSSNATSSNVQQCATSSNATSSNATDCNATSSNATSSNAQTTETIKVTNTQTNTKPNTTTTTDQEEVKEDVEEEVKTDLTYNNSEITQEILENISSSTESITINLDNNVNISKEIFTAIKGKEIKLTINVGENQIIFNGNNITAPKDINAEISYNLANEDTLLKEIIEDGVVINFANNGKLPGTATIRIKVTDEMKKALNMETILVYHYDEETKELSQMTSNATYKEDGFIEFSIDHNSKYLFVNELIEEKEYTVTTGENTEVKNEVSFLESHKMYIMIIGVSALTIIIVAIMLIVDKKVTSKRKANNNEERID